MTNNKSYFTYLLTYLLIIL